MVANAFVTPTVRPGQVFIPMHYDAVNRLTCASFDPHSRQPSYKPCAVARAHLKPQCSRYAVKFRLSRTNRTPLAKAGWL
jgi:predicted molibdopterin-dependent oxidoreductase YjgC